MHGETLHAYNQMIDARRQRLDALSSSLPGVMWAVIVCCGLIGLVIFMIFAQDHPFRGDLALTAEPYQLIYEHLMK